MFHMIISFLMIFCFASPTFGHRRIFPANALFMLDNSFPLSQESVNILADLIAEVFVSTNEEIERAKNLAVTGWQEPNQVVVQSCTDRNLPSRICNNMACFHQSISNVRNSKISRSGLGLENCLEYTNNHKMLKENWGSHPKQSMYPKFLIFVGDGIHTAGQNVKAIKPQNTVVFYYLLPESFRQQLNVNEAAFQAFHVLILKQMVNGDTQRILYNTNAENTYQLISKVICVGKTTSTGCYLLQDESGERCQTFSYEMSDTTIGLFVESCKQFFFFIRIEACSFGQCKCDKMYAIWDITTECSVTCGSGFEIKTRQVNNPNERNCLKIMVHQVCYRPPCAPMIPKNPKSPVVPSVASPEAPSVAPPVAPSVVPPAPPTTTTTKKPETTTSATTTTPSTTTTRTSSSSGSTTTKTRKTRPTKKFSLGPDENSGGNIPMEPRSDGDDNDGDTTWNGNGSGGDGKDGSGSGGDGTGGAGSGGDGSGQGGSGGGGRTRTPNSEDKSGSGNDDFGKADKQDNADSSKNKTTYVVAAIVGSLLLLSICFIVCLLFLFCRRRQRRKRSEKNLLLIGKAETKHDGTKHNSVGIPSHTDRQTDKRVRASLLSDEGKRQHGKKLDHSKPLSHEKEKNHGKAADIALDPHKVRNKDRGVHASLPTHGPTDREKNEKRPSVELKSEPRKFPTIKDAEHKKSNEKKDHRKKH